MSTGVAILVATARLRAPDLASKKCIMSLRLYDRQPSDCRHGSPSNGRSGNSWLLDRQNWGRPLPNSILLTGSPKMSLFNFINIHIRPGNLFTLVRVDEHASAPLILLRNELIGRNLLSGFLLDGGKVCLMIGNQKIT